MKIADLVIAARNWVAGKNPGMQKQSANTVLSRLSRQSNDANRIENDSAESVDRAKVRPIGDKFVVYRKTISGGEAHESYHSNESDAIRAAEQFNARQRLNANTAKGKYADWWVLESGNANIRPESVRRNDAVAKSAAINETLKARKNSVKSRQEGLSLKQISSREGFCFKCAAEASANGIGDFVIGAANDGNGPVWHAVVMRDGMVYDPTFGKWFEPGIYESLGFKPRLTLSSEQVGDFFEKTNGRVPDAKNQGLGDSPDSDGGRLSRAQPNKSTSEKADEALSKPSGSAQPIDKLAKTVTKLTGIERLTRQAYDKAGYLLNRITPEQVKAGVVSDYGVPDPVIDRRAMLQGAQRVQLRKAGKLSLILLVKNLET
jgi:hypothetical protein